MAYLSQAELEQARQAKADKLAQLDKRISRLTKRQLKRYEAKAVQTAAGNTLALKNCIRCHLQADFTPTVIGSYQQWLAQGRIVSKGSKCLYILPPKGSAKPVFDISQTTLQSNIMASRPKPRKVKQIA